jgi:[NiFe] hydrogenase diaphorase moiety large subunit
MMIFDNSIDLLKDVVLNFLEFFIEESCASCVSCRATTQQIKSKLVKMINGKGVVKDIEDLKNWAKITLVSRCGLGQTAANPVTTSIENFPHLYENIVQKDVDYDTCFDLEAAVQESCIAVNRVPNL